jgi:hypothetical protein
MSVNVLDIFNHGSTLRNIFKFNYLTFAMSIRYIFTHFLYNTKFKS